MSDTNKTNIKEENLIKEKEIEYSDNGLFYLRELTEKEWKEYWKPYNTESLSSK